MTDDVIPARGRYTEEARVQRLAWLRARTGTPLAAAGTTTIDARTLSGNVENFAGSVEVPVGLAGPLLFTGEAVRGSVVAPLATTEGALIASAARGSRALTLAGGVSTRVLSQRMSRAPVFAFTDLAAAARFGRWIVEQRAALSTQVALVSRHARLVDVQLHQIGRLMHVRFAYETADAAGQNMTTAATWQICRWVRETLAGDEARRPVRIMLDGNMSSDKKVSAVSLIDGRGIRVTAECLIPGPVVASVLKSGTAEVVRAHQMALLGGQQAGMIGYGINAANIIAALFTATGQDIACVHESGVSVLSLQADGDDLLASILLPNLVAGTVGGGTALPCQHDWLSALGCAGPGGVRRLAEIVAGFALALDVSTAAAMAGGQFADAHRRLGRSRLVPWLRDSGDLDRAFVQAAWSRDEKIVEVRPHPLLAGDGITSEMGARGERRRFTGLLPLSVWTPDARIEVVAKVKARAEEVIAGIGQVAGLCGPAVAQAWDRWGARSDFTGAHRRELAIYRRAEPALTGLLPRCYGLVEDDDREAYVILMERLPTTTVTWNRERTDRVLRAIAPVHAAWLGRGQELSADGWLHRDAADRHLVKARELWEALARCNAAELPELMDDARLSAVLTMLADLEFGVQELAGMPQTLVHNDFNPRNMCLLDERVVVYDWELATIGVPQRDVAELLAFTLGPDATAADVDHHLAVHRSAMAVPGADDGRRGYQLALQEFVLTRLQLLMAAHIHRECAYLPGVVRTAFRLLDIENERAGG